MALIGTLVGPAVRLATDGRGLPILASDEPEVPDGFKADMAYEQRGGSIYQVWSVVPDGMRDDAVRLAAMSAETLGDEDALKVPSSSGRGMWARPRMPLARAWHMEATCTSACRRMRPVSDLSPTRLRSFGKESTIKEKSVLRTICIWVCLPDHGRLRPADSRGGGTQPRRRLPHGALL